VKRLPKRGCFIHAPCPIRDLHETNDTVAFAVDGWGKKPFYVLLSGVEQKPIGTMIRPLAQAGRGPALSDEAHLNFTAQEHLLMIYLDSPAVVELQLR
jgi:hypothetical protein